jgi:uncharacterized membrane protein
MFSLFSSKKSQIMTRTEKKRVVNAIKTVEKKTSGEVRVYIEGSCPTDSPMQRCVELFQHLDMHKTTLRNAVLIYLATDDRKYAIFGDEGIYAKAGADYWQEKATVLVAHLRSGAYADGLEKCVLTIGASLANYYPPTGNHKNELPDDIIFGKF